jgi:hypothetical protein
VRTLDRLVKEIILKIYLRCSQTSGEDKENVLKLASARSETIIEELISKINLLSNESDKGREKKILLVVDNAEDIIEHS